jgi:hypothetical protein
MDHFDPELVLHLVHAADIGEGDRRPLRQVNRGDRRRIVPRHAAPAVGHQWLRLSGERRCRDRDPEPLGQVLVGEPGIEGHCRSVVFDGLLVLPGHEQQAGAQQEGTGCQFGFLKQRLDQYQGLVVLTLPEEGVGQPKAKWPVGRGHGEPVAVHLLGFVKMTPLQQCVGQMPPQGKALGGDP